MSKYTPGPWFTEQKTATSGVDVYAKFDYICTTSGNAVANAHLIAAAPDLLENLERLIDRLEENNLHNIFPSAYKRAREAINKAKGEQP